MSKQMHRHSPSQHIGLFSFFENKDQLINAVNFIFDALDKWAKSVGDVVNKSI